MTMYKANDVHSQSRAPAIAHPNFPATLGARLEPNGICRFLVWAPRAKNVELKLIRNDAEGASGTIVPLKEIERGYFETSLNDVLPGTRYFYRLNGEVDRPDPASRFQPDGVHGASAVIDSRFDWTDHAWHGIPLHEYIIYELHVGTFSDEESFEGAIEHLDELVELGITTVELMPVAQFPGSRNWGYDGVQPFAPQNSYGGPEGLKKLVNACHARNLAVILDVVYNHIGPEGNYLEEFGHYFTSKHHTPWGKAINFDDEHCDEVRRYFIENALYWIDEFHIDALRLDAVHAIFDFSAQPFLRELGDAVRLEGRRLNRQVFTIAESGLNDVRLLQPKLLGGCGLDAQWSDDFHHSLRTTLTDERSGYYSDFCGCENLAKAFRDVFVQNGTYSNFFHRRHGNAADAISPDRFVIFSQNHDQVGNRMLGERLGQLVSFEQLKLAAAAVILSPNLPLLFMGEEYGEKAPFQYFISHLDEGLVEAVRNGRKEEFKSFGWHGETPDPQSETTFTNCKLNRDLIAESSHKALRDFYKELISLRKTHVALAFSQRDRITIEFVAQDQVIIQHRSAANQEIVVVLHFSEQAKSLRISLLPGCWKILLSSADTRWSGRDNNIKDAMLSDGNAVLDLAPHSAVVLEQVKGRS